MTENREKTNTLKSITYIKYIVTMMNLFITTVAWINRNNIMNHVSNAPLTSQVKNKITMKMQVVLNSKT